MQSHFRARLAALAAAAVLVCSPAAAAQPAPPILLSPARQAAMARAFAPTLVFHPMEDFFPANQELTGAGAWRERITNYQTLTREERLRQASVGYRVFPRVKDGRAEVVVEYWCYYVYNEFTVRGGWLPYRVKDNHPHDLERLYVVLTPAVSTQMFSADVEESDERWAIGAFRIKSVVANAHDGSVPPNRYDVENGFELASPIDVLVERGSHAMAPDVNHDGRFTPGIDSTAILKLQWGIRDRGTTWGRYRSSFMDERGQSAIRLCGPAGSSKADCRPYDLHPVDGLQRWFNGLQLSSAHRRDIVGTTPWLVRTFGDVRIETLMVPADAADGRMLSRMLNRRTKTETGFVAGFTSVDYAPALIIGRRYFWDVPSHKVPDVAAEAIVLMPRGGPATVEATVMGSYSVDAITNVMFGGGWFSRGPVADVVSGIDFRIGRIRVRPIWRLLDRDYSTRITVAF